jgi:hypothetical protein
MSAEVLTTWGVVLELEGKIAELQPDSTSRWFAESRDAFFKLCPRLAAFLQAEKTELQLTDEHVEPLDNTSGTGGLKIGASVIEVRPSSFEMAVRIRPLSDHPAPPANGRSTSSFGGAQPANGSPFRVRSATSSSRSSWPHGRSADRFM